VVEGGTPGRLTQAPRARSRRPSDRNGMCARVARQGRSGMTVADSNFLIACVKPQVGLATLWERVVAREGRYLVVCILIGSVKLDHVDVRRLPLARDALPLASVRARPPRRPISDNHARP
jgi:hypothetical protein